MVPTGLGVSDHPSRPGTSHWGRAQRWDAAAAKVHHLQLLKVGPPLGSLTTLNVSQPVSLVLITTAPSFQVSLDDHPLIMSCQRQTRTNKLVFAAWRWWAEIPEDYISPAPLICHSNRSPLFLIRWQTYLWIRRWSDTVYHDCAPVWDDFRPVRLDADGELVSEGLLLPAAIRSTSSTKRRLFNAVGTEVWCSRTECVLHNCLRKRP